MKTLLKKAARRLRLKILLNRIFGIFDAVLVNKNELVDFYLHEYDSYEAYRDVQVFHNIRKIENVWADESTLSLMCDFLRENINKDLLQGICHGARNGFEQGFINSQNGFRAIGTDISPTANDYPDSIQWDFHDENKEWVRSFDFVYSNSLDQSWNPRSALTCWLNQINDDGFVVIEHTAAHGPTGASEMDPFGVKPTVMPYVLSDWFGHQVSVNFLKSKKSNRDLEVWLFFVRRLTDRIAPNDWD